MRVELVGHDIQVYVNEVTHSFDWENGFSTNCVFMAPSATNLTDRIPGMGMTSPGESRQYQDDKSFDYQSVPVDVPPPRGARQ
jgi:hypothetical protein